MKDNTILVLNGPGLGDLGAGRGRYGDLTLEYIRDECSTLCEQLGFEIDFRQTDDEDEMFGWIAKDSENFAALIINPLGYLKAGNVDFDMYRSAIRMIAHQRKLVIEVHMTNIFREGAETTKPLQAPEGEMGFISGLGLHSYLLAIRAAAKRLGR